MGVVRVDDGWEVPVFYGDGDQDPQEWTSGIEAFGVEQEFSDFDHIWFAHGFIEGKAADWYDEETTQSAMCTWSDFKTRLFRRFRRSRVREDMGVIGRLVEKLERQWVEDDLGTAKEAPLQEEMASNVVMQWPEENPKELIPCPFPGKISSDMSTDSVLEEEWFEFSNVEMKGKPQSKRKNRADDEMEKNAHQVFDKMILKGKRIIRKRKKRKFIKGKRKKKKKRTRLEELKAKGIKSTKYGKISVNMRWTRVGYETNTKNYYRWMYDKLLADKRIRKKLESWKKRKRKYHKYYKQEDQTKFVKIMMRLVTEMLHGVVMENRGGVVVKRNLEQKETDHKKKSCKSWHFKYKSEKVGLNKIMRLMKKKKKITWRLLVRKRQTRKTISTLLVSRGKERLIWQREEKIVVWVNDVGVEELSPYVFGCNSGHWKLNEVSFLAHGHDIIVHLWRDASNIRESDHEQRQNVQTCHILVLIDLSNTQEKKIKESFSETSIFPVSSQSTVMVSSKISRPETMKYYVKMAAEPVLTESELSGVRSHMRSEIESVCREHDQVQYYEKPIPRYEEENLDEVDSEKPTPRYVSHRREFSELVTKLIEFKTYKKEQGFRHKHKKKRVGEVGLGSSWQDLLNSIKASEISDLHQSLKQASGSNEKVSGRVFSVGSSLELSDLVQGRKKDDSVGWNKSSEESNAYDKRVLECGKKNEEEDRTSWKKQGRQCMCSPLCRNFKTWRFKYREIRRDTSHKELISKNRAKQRATSEASPSSSLRTSLFKWGSIDKNGFYLAT